MSIRQGQDPQAVLERVEAYYTDLPHQVDHTDGLGMDFGEWRFNLRASNTQPLLRVNVETRADQVLMAQRRDELLDMMRD